MPEPHPRPDLQQPVRLGGLRGGSRDREPLGRPPDQHRIADRLGRHDQQQRPRIGGQRLQPTSEALLDPRRDPLRPGQPEPAHRARTGPPTATASGRHDLASHAPPAPKAPGTAHPARARRRPAPPARPAAAAPRTPAPAPTPHPATAHHRPRTTAAGPPPPPPAKSAPPARPETG